MGSLNMFGAPSQQHLFMIRNLNATLQERKTGARGAGAGRPPASAFSGVEAPGGTGRHRGCGQLAARAAQRLDRAAGEARPAAGRVLTGGGRAGSGRLHARDTVKHSPPGRPRPRWEARRDRRAASLPRLLSPSYKYRLGPHPPPPTPGALRTVRRPRAGPRERKGDGAAQVTAAAPAVRQPSQLEAWPPAAPARPLSLRSPPSRGAGDSSPRAVRAAAEPARARPASAEPADAGGGRFRNREGRGGGLEAAGFSPASQQRSLLPGGTGRLLKPIILQGTNGVPRWRVHLEPQTF
ncbi:translation initiation factor IF-2-like [Artibeus jamaicensis]|uniref:translation initiation factor IF-2-like n=1 Tax=Artibeus jamaicensis TaxID=9417 RepID=UPI00235A8B3E|nr:translation initiation factor IF-2-like [Artibeus jamaicensis]